MAECSTDEPICPVCAGTMTPEKRSTDFSSCLSCGLTNVGDAQSLQQLKMCHRKVIPYTDCGALIVAGRVISFVRVCFLKFIIESGPVLTTSG
jgi:hypothetical protein